MPKRRCGTKLVELNNGKSVVPMFNVFTEVPLPSRLRGLIIDDVSFSGDPKTTAYGEKAPAPFVPVGIYDFTNRLVTTVESDYNGFWDVLLPSSNHISCPTPSGVCAGMYRFVGNDSGVPGALNPNYNPRFRTIATEFEALPGVTVPTDLAVTQVGMLLTAPGTGQLKPTTCPVGAATPQLFAVSRPYVDGSGAFTIEGTGFGATQGTGQVTLGETALPVSSWNDDTISVSVPAGTPAGPAQLTITNDGGASTVNGLTFHVLGTGYSPTVREVGPGKQYATIQAALNAAHSATADDLVVVFPGAPDTTNPRNNPLGAYYENLIMASPVKLQGVGPGGFQGNFFVPGSIIDAGAFGGDTQLATDWYTTARRVDLGRQPGRQRRRGRLRPRLAERHHGCRRGTPVHQRVPGHDRRVRHPRRRPAGLPGQHRPADRDPDRPAAEHHHPGRRDLRQRLRALPADHQQRGPEQRRRLRARSGSARPTCPRPTPASTTRTCGSRTTGSSTTAAPTSPGRSVSSPAPTATRSTTTTSAATSRSSTAAA